MQWLKQLCICSIHVYRTHSENVQYEYMYSYTPNIYITETIIFNHFTRPFILYLLYLYLATFLLFVLLFSHVKWITHDSKDIYNVRKHFYFK